jgi:hypothetical protein
MLRNRLQLNGFDDNFTTSRLAGVCDPAPMTIADATQDLMQDLGGGLWQDATNGTSEWDAFFGTDTMDWSAVLNNYSMEPGYIA